MVAQREWLEKDFYKTLGVSKDASDKEITRAYRQLAKKYHPDANPGAEDKFKEISAAYDVLGDATKRKEYDELKAAGPLGGAFPGGGQGGGFDFRSEDLGDLIGGLFNRGRHRNAGPQRGSDQEAEVHIGFVDAVNGATTNVTLTGDASCSTCGGTGAAQGTVPKVCARCGGSGSVSDNQGFFSFSQPCPACNGRGLVVERACPTCHGSGVERRVRTVRVRIPAGVEPNQRIRIRGKGAPGKANGPAGDLYVTVRVGRHPVFGRSGRDLTVSVPITYPEAVLGSVVTVPTLEGSVSLKVPPGTKSGKTFRVRGRGVAASKKGAVVGDLLVTTEIVVPAELTDRQRKAVEALAASMPEDVRAGLRDGGSER